MTPGVEAADRVPALRLVQTNPHAGGLLPETTMGPSVERLEVKR
jgi:hypothetical protein